MRQYVSSEDFYAHQHRLIFESLCRLFDCPDSELDVVTICHDLQLHGDLAEIGGPAYINELMGSVPHAAHADHYSRIVRDLSLRRKLIDFGTDAVKEGFHQQNESVQDSIAEVESRLLALQDVSNKGSDSSRLVGEVMDEAFHAIFERMDKGDGVIGSSTGFIALDDVMGGFAEKSLSILAARPSMGKTALACNFILSSLKRDEGVYFASLEQSDAEIVERMLTIISRVSGTKLRYGALDERDQRRLMGASDWLREKNLVIDDSGDRTVSEFASAARRAVSRYSSKLVVVDYLQLIKSDARGRDGKNDVGSVSRKLKQLAKNLNVPILALAQLNRQVENREDKSPRLSDLRDSGEIEQDADVVMFLHRPEQYDETVRPGEVDVKVAKNRNGDVGTVHLTWIKQCMRFFNKQRIKTPGDFY